MRRPSPWVSASLGARRFYWWRRYGARDGVARKERGDLLTLGFAQGGLVMTRRVRSGMVTGGEAVYHVLHAAGVREVFGVLGGSMLEFYDALHAGGGIAYVGARDERAAGHMADGYARLTGGPGVVLGAQAGPGVVNLVTAVAEAHLAYSPLVVIAGALSRRDLGKDSFQEVDQLSLFAPICKRSFLVVEAERLPAMVVEAISLAMSGRRGAVVLHVPRDLMAARIPWSLVESFLSPLRIVRAGPPRAEDVADIIDRFAESSRPVLVAGAGFKWSQGADTLRRLVEALEVPLVASTGHVDLLPYDHGLFAGQGGARGNWVARRLMLEADFMLVLGTRLGFNSTFHSHEYVSSAAQIVHVDIEPSAVGRYFAASVGLQADAAATAESLLESWLRLAAVGALAKSVGARFVARRFRGRQGALGSRARA